MKSFRRFAPHVWQSFLFKRLVAELPAEASSLKGTLPQTEPAEPNAQKSRRKKTPASRDLVRWDYPALPSPY